MMYQCLIKKLRQEEGEEFMRQGLKLGILTCVHFLVDFACAFWVNYIAQFDGSVRREWGCFGGYYESAFDGDMMFWLILYNFCAFALQLPLGMLFDRLHPKKPWRMAALGCILIGIAGVVAVCGHIFVLKRNYTLPEILIMLFLLGIGNAFFHVGAGVRVLQMGERMTPLGVFVSTGALGISLGSFLCSNLGDYINCMTNWCISLGDILCNNFTVEEDKIMLYFLVIMSLLFFTTVALLFWGSIMDSCKKKDVYKSGQKNPSSAMIIFFLFLVVVLRSFQGSFVHFTWDIDSRAILLCSLCIVVGKVLGGVLADRFGVPLTLIPLFLSALLFLESKDFWFGLGAILLFQTTMPIILSLMHKQLPALPGTAFGLLSFALFVAYLPKFLLQYSLMHVFADKAFVGKWFDVEVYHDAVEWWRKYQEPYVYSIITGISFLLLVFVLWFWHRKERREK